MLRIPVDNVIHRFVCNEKNNYTFPMSFFPTSLVSHALMGVVVIIDRMPRDAATYSISGFFAIKVAMMHRI